MTEIIQEAYWLFGELANYGPELFVRTSELSQAIPTNKYLYRQPLVVGVIIRDRVILADIHVLVPAAQ